MVGRVCCARLVTVLVLALLVAGSAQAQQPPKVTQMVPPSGATDVDPNLTELRVTFDQDMAGGFSWTGGGPTYPKTTGRPRWVDARTCVLPVALEPGHSYQLGINSPSHRNFKSASGVPVVPVRWRFSTRASGPGSPTATPLPPQEQRDLNAKAWQGLKEAIDTRYSYRDVRKVDWPKLYSSYEEKMLSAPNTGEWVRLAAEMLGAAKDLHISFTCEGRQVGTASRSVPVNWNVDALKRSFPDLAAVNPTFSCGRTEDGIGYVGVNSMASERADDYEAFPVVMRSLAATRALVVDLRANSGGGEPLGEKVAGWFTDERRLYAKHVDRDASAPGGFGPVHERWLEPVTEIRGGAAQPYGKPVYVLSGPHIMSSGEAMLLMLKACPNVTVVGDITYGSSGNPKPTELSNGVTVHLPSWKTMRPDGSCFEGEGIKPDVLIAPSPQAFADRDPVLDKALELARASSAP
jgi:hypothetical protein